MEYRFTHLMNTRSLWFPLQWYCCITICLLKYFDWSIMLNWFSLLNDENKQIFAVMNPTKNKLKTMIVRQKPIHARGVLFSWQIEFVCKLIVFGTGDFESTWSYDSYGVIVFFLGNFFISNWKMVLMLLK